MKKKLGRPRNPEGAISPQDFARAGIAMSVYDEARETGQKHSVAVAQTVEFIKQRHPKMRISETEVKRILAKLRPRKSQTILLFERSTPSEEELGKFGCIQEQLQALEQEKALRLQVPSGVDAAKQVTTYKIRFGERPKYPRHNRKTSKE